MSTLIQSGNNQIIKSEDDLSAYFEKHAKSKHNLRLGLEAEFFAVHRSTGKAIPYSGSLGIQAILAALAEKFSYSPLLDRGNIIGLKKNNTVIALEPGGQIELSAPPVSNIFEIEKQLTEFLDQLREIQKKFPDLLFLAVGIQPFSSLDEIEWVPKRRYQLMADYLKSRGPLSHHMMKRTATNQLNLDYTSDADAMQKLRTAMGITSIVTALFSNSSFSEGRPNGYASYRLEIWNHMDPDRSGLLVSFTDPGKTLQDYLDYILDMPTFFIVRGSEWIPLQGLRFREFIRKGFSGHQATFDDFELHLSTAFPEVRIKQYLEVRGADCQSPALIPAVAAFWKGILYDEKARAEAWNLVAFASAEDRVRLHQSVSQLGLRAQLAGQPIFPLALSLVDIACSGLGRQQVPGLPNECRYLEKIRETILLPQKSPGDVLIEKWNGEFQKQPEKLLQYLNI